MSLVISVYSVGPPLLHVIGCSNVIGQGHHRKTCSSHGCIWLRKNTPPLPPDPGPFPSISFLQFTNALTLAQTPHPIEHCCSPLQHRVDLMQQLPTCSSRPCHVSSRPLASQSSSQDRQINILVLTLLFHSLKEKSEVTNSCFKNEQNLF